MAFGGDRADREVSNRHPAACLVEASMHSGARLELEHPLAFVERPDAGHSASRCWMSASAHSWSMARNSAPRVRDSPTAAVREASDIRSASAASASRRSVMSRR